MIVAEAGVGDMVGELEVFRKVPSRQMQVIATEPTKALFAPLYEFDKNILLGHSYIISHLTVYYGLHCPCWR